MMDFIQGVIMIPGKLVLAIWALGLLWFLTQIVIDQVQRRRKKQEPEYAWVREIEEFVNER